jgi:inner membrane protein
MDPVSQGALGAALAASAAGRQQVVAAGAIGAFAGMAPDLDVLLRSAADPLLFLEYHRQFTHALAFIPVGAMLCTLVAYPLARRWLTLRQVAAFCLLGYGSHGLLDACTSYGTQLWWPLSDARVAWNLVAVVDPLLTVPLLVALVAAAFTHRAGLARFGLAWVLVYLLAGLAQGQRAQDAATALAAARGHDPAGLLVQPSFANLGLWKAVYADGNWDDVDAVRAGLTVSYYPGDRIRRLDTAEQLHGLRGSATQARDLARFARFSGGYLALDREVPSRVIDVRYSLLPNRIDPLWGIELQLHEPDGHVRFVTDRATTSAQRQDLLRMVLQPGVPLDAALDAQSW